MILSAGLEFGDSRAEWAEEIHRGRRGEDRRQELNSKGHEEGPIPFAK